MTHKCCRSHIWYISGGSAVREFLPLAGKSPPLWTPIRRLPSDRKLPFMSFSSFWGFIQNEIWRTGQILWALGAETDDLSSKIKIWFWTLLFLIRSPLNSLIKSELQFPSDLLPTTAFISFSVQSTKEAISFAHFIWGALFISSDNSQQRLDSLWPTQFSEQRNSLRLCFFVWKRLVNVEQSLDPLNLPFQAF